MFRRISYAAIRLGALITVALFLRVSAADAKQSPEEKCQKGRYNAAAKYAACEQKALAKYFGGDDFDQAPVSKADHGLARLLSPNAVLHVLANGVVARDDARSETFRLDDDHAVERIVERDREAPAATASSGSMATTVNPTVDATRRSRRDTRRRHSVDLSAV